MSKTTTVKKTVTRTVVKTEGSSATGPKDGAGHESGRCLQDNDQS